ncbi:hypothetical protein [Escherichia coli]|uniref:hypothetical protein n=1 Tax=Escherichia coli TaxID=562 RepID=UPI000AFADFFD|nr:hypothetical protein [Escherichia coli]
MSKHHKHHKQAHKEVKEVPVFVKRSVAAFRKLWEEEREIQWDELKLVHELNRWL